MNNQEIADILEKAAEVIDTQGWIKGGYENENGVCALGAINTIIAGKPRIVHWSGTEQTKDTMETVRTLFPVHDPLGRLIAFNDSEAQDSSDITDLFKMKAKELRS